jgi:hypothetical protein
MKAFVRDPISLRWGRGDTQSLLEHRTRMVEALFNGEIEIVNVPPKERGAISCSFCNSTMGATLSKRCTRMLRSDNSDLHAGPLHKICGARADRVIAWLAYVRAQHSDPPQSELSWIRSIKGFDNLHGAVNHDGYAGTIDVAKGRRTRDADSDLEDRDLGDTDDDDDY